jgi:hypothetical protein
MSGYRELLEPTSSKEVESEWVDFPASPDPDPWAALLRKANRLPPMTGTQPGGNASLPGRTSMIERRPFGRRAVAVADQGSLKAGHHSSLADHWDARRIGGAVMTSLGIALRGLLVTTTAVAIVAFLLLTNSHI